MTALATLLRGFFRLRFAAVLPVCLAAGVSAAVPEPGGTIVCPGGYRGHLQGLATDGKAIYWVFTRNIVKTGFDGRLLAKCAAPGHSGDPCWKDGGLYVPVCRSGFNRELKPGTRSLNYIYVYDSDLKPVKKYRIPEVKYGAGCVAEHGGRFFVAGGRPEGVPGNTVYEYSPDFKLLGRREVAFDSLKGIQTINFAFGRWYFGCYGTGSRTVEADENFRVTRKLLPGSSVGMIALPDGKVLAGRVAEGGGYRRGGAVILVFGGFAPAEEPPKK